MSKEKVNNDVQPVFLEERTLFHPERPLREGYVRMSSMWGGSTTLRAFINHDYFNETFGDYLVIAAAATYLADVIRFNREIYADTDERKPHEERIFVGGIQIYKDGIIPGTNITGLDSLEVGKIWLGRLSTELSKSGDRLLNIVFPDNNPAEIQKRIRQILRGYEQQRDADEEAHHAAISGAADSARFHEHERIFGTFGRGC